MDIRLHGQTRAAETEVRHRLMEQGYCLTGVGELILRDTAEFFATHGAHVAEGRRMTWQRDDIDRLHLCMLDNILYAGTPVSIRVRGCVRVETDSDGNII